VEAKQFASSKMVGFFEKGNSVVSRKVYNTWSWQNMF